MNGYVARKGHRWYAVVYEGVDPETGKERRRWVPAGADRAEAEDLARRLGTEEEQRRSGRRSQPTVAGFLLRYWLPAKQAQLAPVTFAGYQRMIRLHVIPHIGDVVLRKLQAEELEQLYTMLLEEGRSDNRGGLSPKTVHEIHVILRAAFGNAVRKHLLRENPARLANAPKHRRNTDRAHRVWTADQLRCFLQESARLRHHPLFWLAAHTGMRRSEILGLRWSQVDVDASRLSCVDPWSQSDTRFTKALGRPAAHDGPSTSTQGPSRCSPDGGTTKRMRSGATMRKVRCSPSLTAP